jgi:hypothetical protein
VTVEVAGHGRDGREAREASDGSDRSSQGTKARDKMVLNGQPGVESERHSKAVSRFACHRTPRRKRGPSTGTWCAGFAGVSKELPQL